MYSQIVGSRGCLSCMVMYHESVITDYSSMLHHVNFDVNDTFQPADGCVQGDWHWWLRDGVVPPCSSGWRSYSHLLQTWINWQSHSDDGHAGYDVTPTHQWLNMSSQTEGLLILHVSSLSQCLMWYTASIVAQCSASFYDNIALSVLRWQWIRFY